MRRQSFVLFNESAFHLVVAVYIKTKKPLFYAKPWKILLRFRKRDLEHN
jgi:hypothetical protein